MTLYNLTKSECKCLVDNYNTENLALLLWNKGKAKTLESGIKKAKKIKNFIDNYTIIDAKLEVQKMFIDLRTKFKDYL